MRISLIAAVDRNFLIGNHGKLPWHLPSDMRWFRKNTMGKTVIMGRKTWESIPERFRPLKGRFNVVLTRRKNYQTPVNVLTCSCLQDALEIARDKGYNEAVIIGGSSVYREGLAAADQLYLTRVEGTFKGDTWFPNFDESQWEVVFEQERQADDDNPHAHTFQILRR